MSALPAHDVVGAEALLPPRPATPRIPLLKLALSLLVLGGLGWHFRHDLGRVTELGWRPAAAASLLLLLQPPLIGVRWWLLLRCYDSGARPGMLTGITWISVFANQFLPASVGGDLYRIYALQRQGEALSLAVVTTLLDRLIALLALAMVLAVLGPALAEMGPLWSLALAAACLVGIGMALGLLRFAGYLERWPALRPLARLLRFTLALARHPGRALAALGLSVLVHLLSLTAFLIIARGIGITLDTLTMFALAALLTFVQVVPISIGGWGAREMAAVGLFGLYGVAGSQSMLASVLLGLAYAAASLPGAVVWPWFRRADDAPAG